MGAQSICGRVVDLVGLATPPWERRRPRRQVLAGITGIFQGSRRPELVIPSSDRVARPDECGRGECDGPARAPALPGSRTRAITARCTFPAYWSRCRRTGGDVVNAMGRRGRRRSQDHASQKSPPVAHSPRMGRGSWRTGGDVVNAMGRRGRRRSQDHAPRHSPPDAHSPSTGRVPDGLVGRSRSVGLAIPRSRLPYRFTSCAAM